MVDLSKYLKNKDVTISNEDFDIEKFEKDIYKGYTKSSDIPKPDYSGYVEKEKFDKLQTDYNTMENNYNTSLKTLSETNDKIARVSLENKLVKKGFKEENFDELVTLRNSLYVDEKDDQKAVDSIAEKFKNTYLQEEKKFTSAPDEKGNNVKPNGTDGIKITRKTSIRDLIVR